MGADVIHKIWETLKILEGAYGKKRRLGSLPVLDHVLICLLQEGGEKVRAKEAHQKLLAVFVGWNEVRVSSSVEIAEVLSPIYKSKAVEIATGLRAFLTDLHTNQNRLSLDPLADLPPESSIELLDALPGLSEQARECVLNQSLCNPDVPMSGDVVRVAKRIGLVGPSLSYAKARESFNDRLKAADQLRLNLLFYQHAQKVCILKGYDCLDCVLVNRCDRGKKKRTEARRNSSNGSGSARKSATARGKAAGSKAVQRRKASARNQKTPSVSASSKRARGTSSSKETQQVETTTLARKSAAVKAAKSASKKKKKPAKKAAKKKPAKKKPAKKAAKKKPAKKKAAKKKPAKKKAAKKKSAKKKTAKRKSSKRKKK